MSFSLALTFACTFSKSSLVKNSEVLKSPASEFSEGLKGFACKSAKTSSFTFHTPIAEGSASSTLFNSPERKYPRTEFPFEPSVFLFLYNGPDNVNPNKL